jgi:hypothetical protein
MSNDSFARADERHPFSSVLTLAEHSGQYSRGANDSERVRSSWVRRGVPSEQGHRWFLDCARIPEIALELKLVF